jgi:hypothetical protein
MPRPFTRAQALENMAFLTALRATGNARDAVRTPGVHRAKFTKRRARDPAFAADRAAARERPSRFELAPSILPALDQVSTRRKTPSRG